MELCGLKCSNRASAIWNSAERFIPSISRNWKGLLRGQERHSMMCSCPCVRNYGNPAAWQRGCTDMAARGRATLDGSTLVAHTNDLLPQAEKNLVLLKIQAEDEPEFLGISSGGIAISAGINAARISLTGNQLDNNDTSICIPTMDRVIR